ncbi:MAG: hypothetical protein KDA45_05350 [Planctomycetales bacterium]|nr:hypothetical protein [Planctomycetales bacterium]
MPSPLSTPFALHAELPLDWPADGRLSLPVVSVPAAASGESILILPADVATPAGQMPLELLPATVCCSDRQLSQWVADLSPTEQARLVAARMETGVSQNIEMEVRPLPSNSGWGWSESIQHYLYEDGTLRHQLQWEISDTERRAVEVKLPGGWKVEQARIDGKRIQLDSPRQEILSFELPRGGNSTLQLDCTSQRPRQRGWLSFERFERPQISLPVMERQEALWFPPSRVPLREWELTQRKTRLADRLLPSLWWRLLAPTGPALAVDSEGPQPNWSRVTLQPLSSHEVQGAAGLTSAAGSVPRSSVGLWTIDKTAFSAFSLASALALGALAWWGLGTSVRLWWLVLSFCAVAVVLLPPRWLPLGQLILMTVSCTALLRLSSVVGRIRKVGQRPWTGSGVYIQGSTFRAGLLCLLIGAADAVQAQPFRPAESPTTDNREVAEIRPEIFGVLIPVDKERQVSGAWAYAPTRLLELLNSPRGARLRFSQPRILSADYTLRTRRNVANQQEQVQELSAEFRLQFNLADSEIRLPFNRSEVSLLGGTAGGQPLFVGGRSLTQLPDAIVFRPASSGTVRLQLQLEPLQITQLENEASFRCNIPPIPNATLRIVSDGTATFKVRSASGEQKPHTTSASELLGPVDQLAVEWTQVARRALGGSLTAEVYAETWVHARGPQAQAICQLRIRNPRALPRELHLISEPGWEPVGTSWGDGQLIGNEPSSLGGRRVYTVQVVENWHERPQLTMQVVMVPRETGNATTMTLPFLSLQEVSQQAVTRALAWSVEGEPLWRPDSLDFWQEIPAAEGPDWGPLALNVQPKLYRVPMGNNALSLRRLPAGQADAVDEITRVHLSESEARIHYHGQCRTSQRVLTLIIPQSASVDSVLLNNNTPDYRVSQREDYSLIEILPYENMAAFRVLEVRLRQPVELEQATQLPRVVLRGFEAQSSIYRLMRTTGLTCELSTSNELQLEAVSAQPADLLADLETLVGQVDLRDRFRTAQLPLQFTLRPQVALPNISAILYMDRSEQGWKARVKAQWDTTPAALDFIFFELPIAARESLNAGSLPFRLLPMGDSARTTLCLLPRQSPTGKSTVEFEFQLPALASSQAVAVPHVAVLATAPVYPTLALPARIDAQRVRWLRTGRRLDEAWQDPLRGDDRNTDYQYFEMEESHSQVIWKPLENEPQRARLLASRISLLGRQPQLVSGSIDYWIQPGGQLHFPLRLPANCQVLGVQIGGQPAIWHAQEEQLSVLLQPNYMPLRLRLLIQWNTAGAQTATLQLPQVLLTNQSHSGLVVVDNRLTDMRLSTNFNNGVPEGASRALANRWAELLLDALPTLSGQSHEEVETWLPQWHPQAVGFQGSEIVDSPVVQAAMRAFGNEADEGPSAGSVLAVWNAFCSQAKASEALVQGAAADGQPEASDSALTILTSGQGQLNLISLEAPSGFLSQSTAAGLLAAAALLVLVLAGRVRGGYLALLSAHPWVFWLQLAGLCWLLLPVSWPSWILLLAAASMLLGQVNESRRRTHRMARV